MPVLFIVLEAPVRDLSSYGLGRMSIVLDLASPARTTYVWRRTGLIPRVCSLCYMILSR